jgi:hypothetical protein
MGFSLLFVLLDEQFARGGDKKSTREAPRSIARKRSVVLPGSTWDLEKTLKRTCLDGGELGENVEAGAAWRCGIIVVAGGLRHG